MQTEKAEWPCEDNGIPLFKEFQPHNTIRDSQIATRLCTPVVMHEIAPAKEDGRGFTQKICHIPECGVTNDGTGEASRSSIDGWCLPLSEIPPLPVNHAAYGRNQCGGWFREKGIDHERNLVRQKDVVVHAPLQVLPLRKMLERHKVLFLRLRLSVADIAHTHIRPIRLHQFLCAVIRGVVTDDHLDVRIGLGERTLERFTEIGGAVVRRDHDAHKWCFEECRARRCTDQRQVMRPHNPAKQLLQYRFGHADVNAPSLHEERTRLCAHHVVEFAAVRCPVRKINGSTKEVKALVLQPKRKVEIRTAARERLIEAMHRLKGRAAHKQRKALKEQALRRARQCRPHPVRRMLPLLLHRLRIDVLPCEICTVAEGADRSDLIV